METRLRKILKSILLILSVALLAICLDVLIVKLSHDDSIWIGRAINVTASVIFGPVVGGLATLTSSFVTDFLVYQNFDYAVVDITESLAIALIGLIYRKLNPDRDKFGVKEIAIFNFVQVLVNSTVIYLATSPVAIMFFGSVINDWTREELLEEISDLRENTLSICVSIALLGTVMIAAFTAVRRKFKEKQSFAAALSSFLKPTFLNREYRARALEYTVGIFFAITLSMVDGVVSGHVLGMDALAATSIMVPLISLSTFISNILISGCSNRCAVAKGRGDYETARKLFSLGLIATIVLGLMQSGLFYLMQDLYFDYFTSTEAIGIFAREYYNFYILVPPVMALSIFLDEMAASDGDDMLSYAGYLTSFGVNVGLSIFLSRTMGMGGLALATFLSYVCYVIVVSTHFLKKSNTYKLRFWFSFRDLYEFAKYSIKTNISGLCMLLVSTAFTKAILLFWGSEYLIANTVLCAMLEIYEIINGPSEAEEYLLATYTGEKNGEGIKILFNEALVSCVFIGMVVSLFLLLWPSSVLLIYGIEDSPLQSELIQCIRFCSVGMIAAGVGGFLGDYYGNIGKPVWSSMMVAFRTAVFPMLFCVTFCLEGGIVAMGKGMLLSQITAVLIFYGFVLIRKGSDSIPYMLDDPDFEKVRMISFDFADGEYERVTGWIDENLKTHGIDEETIKEVNDLVFLLCKKTGEKRKKRKVLGECVIRYLEVPEIIIKDSGELGETEIKDERLSYNVLFSRNCNTIRIFK